MAGADGLLDGVIPAGDFLSGPRGLWDDTLSDPGGLSANRHIRGRDCRAQKGVGALSMSAKPHNPALNAERRVRQ